jgi:hypothetical protein
VREKLDALTCRHPLVLPQRGRHIFTVSCLVLLLYFILPGKVATSDSGVLRLWRIATAGSILMVQLDKLATVREISALLSNEE